MRELIASEVSPELYHYTSLGGLKGILESQCLRATRYDRLNDKSELYHFQSELTSALIPFLRANIRKRSKSNAHLRKAVKLSGGPMRVAFKDSVDLIGRFFRVTFEGDDATPAFATPYITSFCSHSHDDVYIRRNGLLSQWRGYGTAGRFALVFSTRKLESMLSEEATRHSYSFLTLCDVVYNNENLRFEDRFAELLQEIEHDWEKHVLHEGSGAKEDILKEFIKDAARFKHRAFFEEREYRIVACPMTDKLDELFREMGAPPVQELPFKQVELDETRRPFIALLRGASKHLPIKRVIVGPHPRQGDLLRDAVAITKGAIPIHCSETPYIG